MGDHSFDLYTYSHPNHGLEAAQELFQHTHIDTIEATGNPCYPEGRSHSATGDYHQCAQLLTQILPTTRPCNSSMGCAWDGVPMPRITSERFFAIENFYYTAKFYGLLGAAKKAAEMDERERRAVMEELKLHGRSVGCCYCQLV